MSSDSDVTWITVNGLHIPIQKGQSKNEAIQNAIDKVNSYKEPSGGNSSSSGGSKSSKPQKKEAKTPKSKIPPDVLTDTKTFSQEEIDAAKAYEGEKYRAINQGMRLNKLDPENQQRRDLIYKAMEKSKLGSDVTVYRGIPEKFANQLLTTQSMTDLGFQSTSTEVDIANEFAEMGGAKYNSNILRFVAKSGTPALNFGSEREKELLLKPSKYTPIKSEVITEPDGRTVRIIHVERTEI
jgi:hypothetical protein